MIPPASPKLTSGARPASHLRDSTPIVTWFVISCASGSTTKCFIASVAMRLQHGGRHKKKSSIEPISPANSPPQGLRLYHRPRRQKKAEEYFPSTRISYKMLILHISSKYKWEPPNIPPLGARMRDRRHLKTPPPVSHAGVDWKSASPFTHDPSDPPCPSPEGQT